MTVAKVDLIEVWTDGCCEPVNPGGTAGWGAHIRQGETVLWEGSGMIAASPTTSNNVAEYMAFLEALKWLLDHGHQGKEIIFRADSKLVVEQMNGRWRMHEGRYIPIALKSREMFKRFKRKHLIWIPRDENGLADELSKREVKKAGVTFRIQPEEDQQSVRG